MTRQYLFLISDNNGKSSSEKSEMKRLWLEGTDEVCADEETSQDFRLKNIGDYARIWVRFKDG